VDSEKSVHPVGVSSLKGKAEVGWAFTGVQDGLGEDGTEEGRMKRRGEAGRPSRAAAEEAIATLLRYLGQDLGREGLRGTPRRVVGAWEEHTAGYGEDPAEILGVSFGEIEGYQGMVVLAGIPFVSHCEHHLAPIVGTVDLGYLPDGRVVGLSKLARLVDVFARRLQIQERMTAEIASALETHLRPRGCGVVVRAVHHCMMGRGVRKAGASMRTSDLRGVFRDDPATRAEFERLVLQGGSAPAG
jgi:GTP cyclohydrolase I